MRLLLDYRNSSPGVQLPVGGEGAAGGAARLAPPLLASMIAVQGPQPRMRTKPSVRPLATCACEIAPAVPAGSPVVIDTLNKNK